MSESGSEGGKNLIERFAGWLKPKEKTAPPNIPTTQAIPMEQYQQQQNKQLKVNAAANIGLAAVSALTPATSAVPVIASEIGQAAVDTKAAIIETTADIAQRVGVAVGKSIDEPYLGTQLDNQTSENIASSRKMQEEVHGITGTTPKK